MDRNKFSRLCFRVLDEYVSRIRCGQSLSGLATHCGVSVADKDMIIKNAEIEQVIDAEGKYQRKH